MRRAVLLPLITRMIFILAVGIVCHQRWPAESAIQELADQLHATRIDFACEETPPPEALKRVLQKLAEKNPNLKVAPSSSTLNIHLPCNLP